MQNSPQIYGLLGWPVSHSFSPAMHNAAFQALGLDAEYRLFPKSPQEVDAFLQDLSRQPIRGLNVTVPYKEKAMGFMKTLSEEARLIGAVNTIKIDNDTIAGYNTDGEGFLRHISEVFDFDPHAASVAIIGCGGAARAVAVYLCKARARRIALYDIEKEKAAALAAYLSSCCSKVEFKVAGSVKDLDIATAGLLINASPVGMKESDPLLVDESWLHKDLLVYDLVYNPAQTKLLSCARQKGCRVSNGLGMLLYQGMISFKLWTGKEAPQSVMHQALVNALAR